MPSDHKQPILKNNDFEIPVKPATKSDAILPTFLSTCRFQIIGKLMVTLDNSNAMGYD
jgi:hypothetical protein